WIICCRELLASQKSATAPDERMRNAFGKIEPDWQQLFELVSEAIVCDDKGSAEKATEKTDEKNVKYQEMLRKQFDRRNSFDSARFQGFMDELSKKVRD